MLLISGGQAGNSTHLKSEADVSADGTVCSVSQPAVLRTLTFQSLAAILCTSSFNIKKFSILPTEYINL
jgi:hypothetical protein